MKRIAQIFRTLLVTLIIVSVSVCCCHANTLTGTFSASAVGCASGHSCCSGGDSTATDDDSNERPASPTGCKACCIKGTGLESAKFEMPPTLVVFTPLPAVDVMPLWSFDRIDGITTPAPYVAPPTLLRQRCALII